MKNIHDLKNPLLACKQIVNDNELEILDIKIHANKELEDLEDMMENLRTGLKARNDIELKEEFRIEETEEFIISLKRAHARLSENGNNRFRI